VLKLDTRSTCRVRVDLFLGQGTQETEVSVVKLQPLEVQLGD
jgi:hypothetical protein